VKERLTGQNSLGRDNTASVTEEVTEVTNEVTEAAVEKKTENGWI